MKVVFSPFFGVNYDIGSEAKKLALHFGQSQVRVSSLFHNELARPLGVKQP
jgi:hypothetical protein